MRYAPDPLADRGLRPITSTDFQLVPAPATLQVAECRPATSPLPCPECAGAGWYKLAVPLGHPEFGRLQPCACTQAERAHTQAVNLLQLSQLGAFRQKTFAAFEQAVPGTQQAYQAAVRYACQPTRWLALFGWYGCGKTHLAAAIANDLVDRGVAVLFVVVPDLLDHLRSTFAPESTVTYDQRFDQIRHAPLLLLDDLGTESTTAWAREKLFQVVNSRYNAHLPTVFTSNVAITQIDPRIASRMHDAALGAEIIMMTAGDYRQRKRVPMNGQH